MSSGKPYGKLFGDVFALIGAAALACDDTSMEPPLPPPDPMILARFTKSTSRFFRRVCVPTLAVVVWMFAIACGSDGPAAPGGTGFVQVIVNVAGPDEDSEVRVTLNGDAALDVMSNSSEVFTDVPAGEHEVTISGVAENCSVEPSDFQAVVVDAGSSSTVVFSLLCERLFGTLVLEVRTSGAPSDPDGYSVAIDGFESGRVVPNGSLEVILGAGGHEVRLDDLAENCRPENSRRQSVIVAPNETVGLSMEILCAGGLQSGQIVVRSRRGHRGEIYQMGAGGSNPVRLTESTWGSWQPSVSPDRQHVAFVHFDGSIWGIWTMNGDGSNVQLLASGPVGHPAWSRDGARILFTHDREIWVMNADGSSQQRLRPTDCTETDPTWSPSGDRIAFVTCGTGTAAIWIMNADGSDARQLTSTGDNLDPTWSPDGSRIAFWSFRDGKEEILVINTDGTAEVNITAGRVAGREPAWSPDGTKIVFAGGVLSGRPLYVVNPDGTELTLIDDGGANSDPTWVP